MEASRLEGYVTVRTPPDPRDAKAEDTEARMDSGVVLVAGIINSLVADMVE